MPLHNASLALVLENPNHPLEPGGEAKRIGVMNYNDAFLVAMQQVATNFERSLKFFVVAHLYHLVHF